MSPSTTLRGGIVGCGYFAQFHIEAWRRIPGVELAAAADPVLARARQVAPRAYSTAEDMFDSERLDFVDIATRPDSHLPLVRLAAGRKTPVICQKPMAQPVPMQWRWWPMSIAAVYSTRCLTSCR